jgi:hypothetical protein
VLRGKISYVLVYLPKTETSVVCLALRSILTTLA